VKRAEAPRGRRNEPKRPRFEIDRTWLLRGAVAVLAVLLLLLIAKVSMMAFGGVAKRLDRHDPGRTSAPANSGEPARNAR
jgi:hypothetical protein